MNDTLELEPRTEVATAAATALDLERIDLTKIALAKFGDWLGDVSAVTANLNTMVLDLSTAAKCKEARSLRQRLIGTPVADARKIAAGIKSKMAATSKAVGAELEIIEQAYDKADTLILPKIEAREQELEAERQEKARIEAERVAKHQRGIATIRAYLVHCQQPDMTAERIGKGIEALQANAYGADWEEFQVPAANAQCETLEAMRQLHAQVLGREQEAARQEAIRLENERQAEANRIEAKRIADEATEIRRQAAELAAQREAAAAEQRAKAILDVTTAAFDVAMVKNGYERATALHEGFVAAHGELRTWSDEVVGTYEYQMRALVQPRASDPTPVTAAGFASLGERFTDEDPGAATKIPTGEVHESTDPQEGVGQMEVTVAASDTIANIKLGDLCTWAGFTMTRAFVEGLGIHPMTDGTRVLFTAGQRRKLKAALLEHVEGLPA